MNFKEKFCLRSLAAVEFLLCIRNQSQNKDFSTNSHSTTRRLKHSTNFESVKNFEVRTLSNSNSNFVTSLVIVILLTLALVVMQLLNATLTVTDKLRETYELGCILLNTNLMLVQADIFICMLLIDVVTSVHDTVR